MPKRESNGFPRLFIVRHGNTDWSDTRKHTGLTDIPLNAIGERRASELGQRLESIEFARVFTSPLVRASRTCEIAGFGDRAEVDHDLVEWDYGKFEGRLTTDIQKEWPNWNLFRDGAPGGESPEEVATRVDRFVTKIHPIEGDVLAFSSGHTSRMIVARWLGLQPVAANYFYTATASIGILGYEHDRHEPVVLLWNSI